MVVVANELAADVTSFYGADGPFIARVMLAGLFARYGREKVRDELIRQAQIKGVLSIAASHNWYRPKFASVRRPPSSVA